ncbi:CoA transferase [Xylophilus sp. Kf1]|nr:CoA transferase [Xylophilus sp. Kf1]
MDNAHKPVSALAGVRVLDLCGGADQYAGKLLAQLGADVILVEPVQGCRARRQGPFVDGRPHFENSLSFAYWNQGKRGIGLELDSDEGRSIFRTLAGRSDIVISSEAPGRMAARGLDGESLRRDRPGLVTANISLFGESGPYADYRGDDLVAMAMGGLLNLGGYPGQAPTAPWGEQGLLAAAQFAAVGCLVALWQVEQRSGAGQHLDVSVQESVAMALENSAQFFELEAKVRQRNGGEQRQAGTGVFACRDGMVYLMAGGIASNRFWAATAQWLVDVAAPGAARLQEPRWNDQAFLQTEEAKDFFASVFLPYAAGQDKADLYAEGQRRRIPICPVSTPADLLDNRQLVHRHFFQQVAHPHSGRQLTLPGAPYRLGATPWVGGAPAPCLGQHTADVLSAIGIEPSAQQVLLRQGAIA